MPIPGYADYRKREFCNDMRCPVQIELNSKEEGSKEYEETRRVCRKDCRFTAWQFHNWLIEKGYLIVKPEND